MKGKYAAWTTHTVYSTSPHECTKGLYNLPLIDQSTHTKHGRTSEELPCGVQGCPLGATLG